MENEVRVSTPRWAAEHSAAGAPVGLVLYDDDDNLFTVKTKQGEWVTYSCDQLSQYAWNGPLRDADIDGDRGDQIVGKIDV